MKKLVLVLSVLLAFASGFALNGLLQNCRMSGGSGHAACERHHHGMERGDCCAPSTHPEALAECCRKHAAGDEQECCRKHAAGEEQECCSKKSPGLATAHEIKVPGHKKACCK